jgi:CHAT domain-containing protein
MLRQHWPDPAPAAPASTGSNPFRTAHRRHAEDPGLQDLESTTEEAEDITRRSPAHELLTGPSATRDAVAQAMPHHLWAHYACHGSQDLGYPFRGALHVCPPPARQWEAEPAERITIFADALGDLRASWLPATFPGS